MGVEEESWRFLIHFSPLLNIFEFLKGFAMVILLVSLRLWHYLFAEKLITLHHDGSSFNVPSYMMLIHNFRPTVHKFQVKTCDKFTN